MSNAKTNSNRAAHEHDAHEVATGAVISEDGTEIGYLRVGRGPAVVVLHGSFQSASSHLGLAAALADRFTVYLPDRRGHALSGPTGATYGMRCEVEDLQAVVRASGAENVFGVSSSGLIALEAARRTPTLRHVALYEPVLLMDTGRYVDWLARFDREMADGDVAAALITSMIGLDLAPPIMRVLPRRLLEFVTRKTMEKQEADSAVPGMTMRELAPTIRNEGILIAEMAGTLARFADLDTEVLLMGGTRRGPAFIKPALEALASRLANCARIEFDKLDHGSAADPSKMNRFGRPDVVSQPLLTFFQ